VLDAGAPAIQLRAKNATASELFEQARELRTLTRKHNALLFVNDRIDVALAAEADGVHLGPDDLPVAVARRSVPGGFLIGFSADDPEEARRAERDGADYIGCGSVFGTTTKAEAANEQIGVTRLDQVAAAVRIPVIGIGGINLQNIEQVAATRARGAAVVGAIMSAPDPAAVTRVLLAAFR
jgi:thiamine-phosphate pyrophosphorylase